MPADTGSTALNGELAVAEGALGALTDTWEAAIDEVGSTIPPVQLRALLAIAAAAPISMTTLAGRLRASASAASRLCDRLQQVGLITRQPGQSDRRGVRLSPTPAGYKLAAWVREKRRASLAAILGAMTPGARQSLIDGLREVPTTVGQPSAVPSALR